MLPKRCVTSLNLENGKSYPKARVVWIRDDDELGVTGTMTIMQENYYDCDKTEEICLRQSSPLTGLFISFAAFEHGAWQFTDIPIEGLTERDLHWATAWAVQAYYYRQAATGR